MLKFLKKSFLFGIAILFSIHGIAQKQANTWYFGRNAGVSFSSGKPVAITNGELFTNEGCATISNANGVLLFYTDGVTVYNADHAIMQNGKNLLGSKSSTQAAIAVAHPGDTSKYYLFTTDAAENSQKNGLRYNIIDMSLNGGKGEVTTKNELLYTPSTEKITAVLHQNRTDIWVISHRNKSDEFVVYKITKGGLQLAPIISKVGSIHEGGAFGGNQNSTGYLKVSPNGNIVALTLTTKGALEIFDFDKSNGKLSNARANTAVIDKVYGLEFSSSSSKLYISTIGGVSNGDAATIYQYDVLANDIYASRIEIVKASKFDPFGAMQLGPDKKIYVTRNNWKFLNVINDPDSSGSSCNYTPDAINLGGKISRLGLPSFVQSYFAPEILSCAITYKGTCVGEDYSFYATTNDSLATSYWDFGDINSIADTSVNDTANYTYTKKGFYTAKLIAKSGFQKCEVTSAITVKGKPEIILPRDTFLCKGNSFLLSPLQYDGKVSWSTSVTDTFPSIVVAQAGTLIATNTNECGVDKDTIIVQSKTIPIISIISDTLVCSDKPFSASLQSDHKVVSWHDNKFIYNRTFTISDTSILWIKSSNICGTSYDSVTINVYPKLTFKISADSAVCPDVDFDLSASSNSDSSITWFNTSSGKAIKANIPTGQWVWAVTKDQCVTQYDSAFIATYPPTAIELGEDKEICDNAILLDAGIIDAEYVWQNEPIYNTRTFVASQPGVYKVAATRCQKTVTDSITIFPPQDTGVYIPNAFTPNRDLLNDTFAVYVDGFAPKKYQINIYSRWGEEVFKSNNYLQSWDGTFKGQDVPEGAYLYMMNLLHCNRIKRYKGSITLIK